MHRPIRLRCPEPAPTLRGSGPCWPALWQRRQIWVQGLESPGELDPVELEIFFLPFRRLLNPYETAIRQHADGVLDDETFENYRIFTRSLIASPGGQMFRTVHPDGISRTGSHSLDVSEPA